MQQPPVGPPPDGYEQIFTQMGALHARIAKQKRRLWWWKTIALAGVVWITADLVKWFT